MIYFKWPSMRTNTFLLWYFNHIFIYYLSFSFLLFLQLIIYIFPLFFTLFIASIIKFIKFFACKSFKIICVNISLIWKCLICNYIYIVSLYTLISFTCSTYSAYSTSWSKLNFTEINYIILWSSFSFSCATSSLFLFVIV